MPFLAPVIAGALGVGVIGEALIGTAIAIGIGFAARELAPRPKEYDGYEPERGSELYLSSDPNATRQILIGTAATAGTLVYWQTYGADNNYLHLIFALADHECEALSKVYVDGRAVTIEEDDNVTQYDGVMWINFHSGSESQSADSQAVTNGGGVWTSSHRGKGVCYVRVTLKYDEEKYQGGIPEFLFVVKGAKLYDWRKDSTNGGSGSHRWSNPSTWEWSENPAVAWYNYRRGFKKNGEPWAGMATPVTAIDHAAATAAAAACAENVARKSGGTESRYRISATIDTSRSHRDVIEDMLACMAGKEIDSGGTIRLIAGVAQSSVMAITDGDIVADQPVEIAMKRGRNSLVNAVYGTFRDPAALYQERALPPRLSSTDETSDGGSRLEMRFDLEMVRHGTQGQRVLEIFRRRSRRQGTVSFTGSARLVPLEAGDWITWTSSRYGWVTKTWEVVQASLNDDMTVSLTLAETDADVYTWNAATFEIDVGDIADLPAGGPTVTTVSGLAVTSILLSATGGVQRPGLTVTWTPIEDPTVDKLILEYRKSGDATALTRTIEDPASGSYTFVSGIQSGIIYEVRAIPKAVPRRSMSWSSWVSTEATTGDQAVSVTIETETATDIPDEIVTHVKLSPQVRFELNLATKTDAVLGSMGSTVSEIFSRVERTAESDLRSMLQVRDAEGRVDAKINAVSTTVAGHTASIIELIASVDGVSAEWGVAIDIDGNVVGLVRLDGSLTESTFTVVADKFQVAQPGSAGGDPVPVFVIASVNGVNKLALRGDMLIDGTILARHISVSSLSAITANVGTVTAGVIKSADDKMQINLNTGVITIDT